MLAASLEADPGADAVGFTLTVENEGAEPITLSFRDGQRADFAVLDDDAEIWRWSDGRMFAQVLGSESIDPDEAVAFEGAWEDPRSGTFAAIGELVAEDRDVVAETEFTV